MAANKKILIGPVNIPAAATNLANPPTGAGGVGVTATNQYMLLQHIRITNKDTVARTLTLYIGLTGGSAAGTEFGWANYSVPAQSFVEWFGNLRLDAAQFLTGIASVTATLTFEAEGEIGVAG